MRDSGSHFKMADIDTESHTPDIADLLPVREYKCPSGCINKVYRSRTRFDLHLQKVHQLPLKWNPYCKAFHCPIKGCLYHSEKEDAKHFRQLQSLRLHYQRIHMLKKFKCDKCKEEFFLENQLLAHRCHIVVYKCKKCHNTKRRAVVDKSSGATVDGHKKKDVKTYVCKNCGNRFSCRSTQVLKHSFRKATRSKVMKIKLVSGHQTSVKRIYERCGTCKKKFLYQHVCRQHICFICPHVYYGKAALNIHLNRHYFCNPEIDNDTVLIEEMEILLKNIESKIEHDENIIGELIKLVPVFLSASD